MGINMFKYGDYNITYIMKQSTKNIGLYMKKAIDKGSAIYLYDVGPKQKERLDKLSWIRDVKHEEYDMVSVIWENGYIEYCKSIGLNDKVIKLDLTDKDVKKIFDDKFKIGTTWAKLDNACRIAKEDPIFVEEPGYECYNFFVILDDEIIMDALLYGVSCESINISPKIVDEVNEEFNIKDTKD